MSTSRDSKDVGLNRRLFKVNVTTCAAAAVLHAVNCSRALLSWHIGYLHWPLLLLFVLSFAVAVVLTGLSLLAAFRQPPADAKSNSQRRGRSKLLAIAGAVLPLGVVVPVVLGMSALTKWLDAQ